MCDVLILRMNISEDFSRFWIAASIQVSLRLRRTDLYLSKWDL